MFSQLRKKFLYIYMCIYISHGIAILVPYTVFRYDKNVIRGIVHDSDKGCTRQLWNCFKQRQRINKTHFNLLLLNCSRSTAVQIQTSINRVYIYIHTHCHQEYTIYAENTPSHIIFTTTTYQNKYVFHATIYYTKNRHKKS